MKYPSKFLAILRRVRSGGRPRARSIGLLAFAVFLVLLFVAPLAHADTVNPSGIGDLMPSPNMHVPAGQGTLYETYSNPMDWQLDTDYGGFFTNPSDDGDQALEWIADTCMGLIVDIGKATVTLTEWLFNLISLPPLESAITRAIGGASKDLTETLLPAALAAGGIVAFAQNKRASGSAISQIGWVFAAGVLSVSLLTSPQTWVSGIDSARQIGATVALNATSSGLGGNASFPIPVGHQVTYGDNARDTMLRKSADAVWRSYVVAPWCVAEFGSLEVCKRYGQGVLNHGDDLAKRKTWLQNNVSGPAVGDASVDWRAGKNPLGRIMVTVPALVSIAIFAALVLTLVFSALASLLGALMLLACGVIFACLWVIPGKPRQWGLRWFDQLCGMVLQSLVSTLVLGCVLIINAATTQMFATYGWLCASGLSIAAAAMAYHFRKVVESIVGASGRLSPGAAFAGLLATRGATRLARGAVRASQKWSRAHSARPSTSPRAERASAPGDEEHTARPALPARTVRPPRPLPAPARRTNPADGASPPPEAEPRPTRQRRVGDGPPPRRSRPETRPSPEPAGRRRGNGGPSAAVRPSAAATSVRPSPILRPESRPAGFAFRTALPPRDGADERAPHRGAASQRRPAEAPARPAPARRRRDGDAERRGPRGE